jgi:hypothetical protein
MAQRYKKIYFILHLFLIYSLLVTLLMFDDNTPSLPNTFLYAPKRSEFVDRIIPRLQILCESQSNENEINFSDENERIVAINLLKTMCWWLILHVNECLYSAPPELFKFVPFVRFFMNFSSKNFNH